jgi:hypothetical protein
MMMELKWAVTATTIVWLILHKGLVSAFIIVSNDPSLLHCKDSKGNFESSAKAVTLFARRRGKLGSLIEEGVVDMSDFRSKKAPVVKKDGIASKQVSPDLASYMMSKQPESSTSSADNASAPTEASSASTSPAMDTNESKGSLSRRARTTERTLMDEERSKEVKEIVKELQEAIGKRKDVGSAVDRALQRLPINVNQLQQLVKSTNPLDYRLAWIASDGAVCAIGSALHGKIALARLQEVYLTLHRNRLQMYEVVRILGPFPNVKNTLSGSAKFARQNVGRMTITWQSLIDGTGKENFEGGATKEATLDILYGDDQLIVARLVDKDIPRVEECVVFIRDNDMDKTLENLRVL